MSRLFVKEIRHRIKLHTILVGAIISKSVTIFGKNDHAVTILVGSNISKYQVLSWEK